MFKLHDCSRKTVTNLILHASSHSEDTANSAPWHVDKNCCVIVDLNKMKEREDLCADAWRWKLWNTYPTSSPSFEGPYHKGNNPSVYRVVRRTYKYLTHEKIEKQIYLTYSSDVLAISRYQHITKHAGQYSLVLYRFKEKEENLPLAENPSGYRSIRKEVGEHLDAGRVPKRAAFEVTKKLGGLSEIKNASEVPKISHANEFNRPKNNKTDDPLKQLIEKYHEDTKNGQKVIQTFQPNEFPYDIVLYKERIVKT